MAGYDDSDDKERAPIPCFSGSALQNVGVSHFLHQLDLLTVSDYDPSVDFAGRVYKIRHDEQGARLTYIKAKGGARGCATK